MAAPLPGGRPAFPGAAECVGYALDSPILGASIEPVFLSSLGRWTWAFILLRSSTLAGFFFRVDNHVGFRKNQKKHAIWGGVCDRWSLVTADTFQPAEPKGGWNTDMASSSGIVGWLFGMSEHFNRGRSYYGMRRCRVALENIFDMAEKGYQDTPEPQRDSTMTLLGAHLIKIGSGGKLGTPLWGIRQAWPSMEADWRHLST